MSDPKWVEWEVVIEAHDVVQIPADISGRAIERVESHVSKLGQRLGKKILLKPRGQAQFIVDPLHVEIECFIAPAEMIQFGAQAVHLALHIFKFLVEAVGSSGNNAHDGRKSNGRVIRRLRQRQPRTCFR